MTPSVPTPPTALQLRIQQIKDRLEKATVIPWKLEGDLISGEGEYGRLIVCYSPGQAMSFSREVWQDNAIFITKSPEDVTFLLATLEAVTAERDELQKTKAEFEKIHWAELYGRRDSSIPRPPGPESEVQS